MDTATAQPFFTTVMVGLPIRRRLVLVPLSDATVGPGYRKVPRPKSQVKHAPAIDTDGELPAEDEAAVFAHYGLDHAPGPGGEHRLERRSQPSGPWRGPTTALVLRLVIVALVRGPVGVVTDGLEHLLFIGIAVLIVALMLSAVRFRRGGGP
ncbi:hypothetical protein [Kitasatospora sp. NPDC088134]|uniref:hypothetical protein n=1 Tax=Kitasatospora sp. NPDC088134 TaxID=3364071 RepID=UPI00380EE884